MGRVTVELGDRSYPVSVVRNRLAGLGRDLVARTQVGKVVLVTETTVGPLWADTARESLESAGIGVQTLVLPAGEANKTLATWSSLVDALLASGVDRYTPVVALGGGVLGDIAGFAAACTLRGLPFVQVPTTLLAMVDSSVGGKTAVNHSAGKNLIGAFHQPMLVHADVDTLTTLPIEEIRAGLAEAVKTAILGDAQFFAWMEAQAGSLAAAEPESLAHVVERCVALKAAVVGEDEREAGIRIILNLGHTIAHGLEAVLGYGALRHGEAVAIGLVAESRWAVREGHCEPGVPERVEALLRSVGLPTALPEVSTADVTHAMRSDKKAHATFVRVPVPERIGAARPITVRLDDLGALLE